MSHVCLSSGLLKQCQSSVRFSSLGSREQPVSAHHLECGAIQGGQSHEAAPSTSLAMVSPSAVATLWLGQVSCMQGKDQDTWGGKNHLLMLVVRKKAKFSVVAG